MSGWRQLKQRMLDLNKYYHPENILLYTWILLNAEVQVDCVVLMESKYIRSIRKFREDLLFYNGKKFKEHWHWRIQPSSKWSVSEKYKYGHVTTFMLRKNFTCGDYLYWVGISVKDEFEIPGLTSLMKELIPAGLRAAKSM
jgi:hypothetical protein